MSQTSPTQKEANTYAREWLKDANQTRAWKKTFPKSKAATGAARKNASNFHKMDIVKDAIRAHQQAALAKSCELFGTEAADMKQVGMQIIKEGLSKKMDSNGNWVPVDLAAAKAAMAEINRMEGNYPQADLPFDGSISVSITRKFVD